MSIWVSGMFTGWFIWGKSVCVFCWDRFSNIWLSESELCTTIGLSGILNWLLVLVTSLPSNYKFIFRFLVINLAFLQCSLLAIILLGRFFLTEASLALIYTISWISKSCNMLFHTWLILSRLSSSSSKVYSCLEQVVPSKSPEYMCDNVSARMFVVSGMYFTVKSKSDIFSNYLACLPLNTGCFRMCSNTLWSVYQ